MAIGPDIVLQREWDCWCRACFKVRGPGLGPMDSNYQCGECERKEPWFECSVGRKDTRGVAAKRRDAQDAGAKLAKELRVGDVVVVQDREDQSWDIPFMLGKVCDAGAGKGSVLKKFDKRATLDGRRFDAGDTAFVVRW